MLEYVLSFDVSFELFKRQILTLIHEPWILQAQKTAFFSFEAWAQNSEFSDNTTGIQVRNIIGMLHAP